jgi:hypothetical protein
MRKPKSTKGFFVVMVEEEGFFPLSFKWLYLEFRIVLHYHFNLS